MIQILQSYTVLAIRCNSDGSQMPPRHMRHVARRWTERFQQCHQFRKQSRWRYKHLEIKTKTSNKHVAKCCKHYRFHKLHKLHKLHTLQAFIKIWGGDAWDTDLFSLWGHQCHQSSADASAAAGQSWHHSAKSCSNAQRPALASPPWEVHQRQKIHCETKNSSFSVMNSQFLNKDCTSLSSLDHVCWIFRLQNSVSITIITSTSSRDIHSIHGIHGIHGLFRFRLVPPGSRQCCRGAQQRRQQRGLWRLCVWGPPAAASTVNFCAWNIWFRLKTSWNLVNFCANFCVCDFLWTLVNFCGISTDYMVGVGSSFMLASQVVGATGARCGCRFPARVQQTRCWHLMATKPDINRWYQMVVEGCVAGWYKLWLSSKMF